MKNSIYISFVFAFIGAYAPVIFGENINNNPFSSQYGLPIHNYNQVGARLAAEINASLAALAALPPCPDYPSGSTPAQMAQIDRNRCRSVLGLPPTLPPAPMDKDRVASQWDTEIAGNSGDYFDHPDHPTTHWLVFSSKLKHQCKKSLTEWKKLYCASLQAVLKRPGCTTPECSLMSSYYFSR